jgi:hypothetical protein
MVTQWLIIVAAALLVLLMSIGFVYAFKEGMPCYGWFNGIGAVLCSLTFLACVAFVNLKGEVPLEDDGMPRFLKLMYVNFLLLIFVGGPLFLVFLAFVWMGIAICR